MSFTVRRVTRGEADVDPWFDFQRERDPRRDGADLDLPEKAIAELAAGIATLQAFPFTCRKAGHSPFLSELITPIR